ncbi:hypothetical protein UMZ34_13555 [Halopseudomonas pachastrellae]|nr:hypothetical protein UMZ34_13555 [Halopseudomonas pachastrellae]
MKLRYGEVEGQRIFDDIVPLNDAGADTITGRSEGNLSFAAATERQKRAPLTAKAVQRLMTIAQNQAEAQEARTRLEQAIGFSRSASRTVVIGPDSPPMATQL